MANFSAGDNVAQFEKREQPLNFAHDALWSHSIRFALCLTSVML